jgi:hypothetical protein
MAGQRNLGHAHEIEWEALQSPAVVDIESCLRPSREFIEASTLRDALA